MKKKPEIIEHDYEVVRKHESATNSTLFTTTIATYNNRAFAKTLCDMMNGLAVGEHESHGHVYEVRRVERIQGF